MLCEVCNGSGEGVLGGRVCRVCRGDGEVDACDTCEGEGQVLANHAGTGQSVWRNCPDCLGSGRPAVDDGDPEAELEDRDVDDEALNWGGVG